MARGNATRTSDKDYVLVRIRRMGTQWATCGIGVRPPEDLIGSRGIKAKCPKLVPGQCRRLPRNHPILKPENSELVEIVSRPRNDEFECPWVFDSAEDAVRANPSKSHLSADQIAEGLALSEGAQVNQRKRLAERERAAREVYEDETPLKIRRDDDEDEDELEDDGDGLNEDVNARRSQNKHLREDDEDGQPAEDEEAPRPRGRRRPGRASRS